MNLNVVLGVVLVLFVVLYILKRRNRSSADD